MQTVITCRRGPRLRPWQVAKAWVKGRVPGRYGGRGIGGAIVHYQAFPIRMGLGPHRFQSFGRRAP